MLTEIPSEALPMLVNRDLPPTVGLSYSWMSHSQNFRFSFQPWWYRMFLCTAIYSFYSSPNLGHWLPKSYSFGLFCFGCGASADIWTWSNTGTVVQYLLKMIIFRRYCTTPGVCGTVTDSLHGAKGKLIMIARNFHLNRTNTLSWLWLL